ncbi:MAG TPA: hypothetical protein VGR08_05685 [Thermomicrobiales bacterium]|nr:hypothetical protein [Thermomicrobiales bacterium]
MPAPERPGLARLSIVVEGGDFVAGDGAAGLARGRADSSPRELRVRSGCPHLVRETLVLLGGGVSEQAERVRPHAVRGGELSPAPVAGLIETRDSGPRKRTGPVSRA